ncbi:MAG TPA: STAS/SEC14 domain-containing protein [Solirubrobacteraceae bacterium]|jgi:hypothetical protein
MIEPIDMPPNTFGFRGSGKFSKGEDSVRHAVGLVGWLYPCEMRIFSLDELETAKEWLAT